MRPSDYFLGPHLAFEFETPDFLRFLLAIKLGL